jgi:NTP pyrophosphatase (non-canonical NTP hydrolase)
VIDHESIYKRALTTFGESKQIDMAIEECAELTLALQHNKRGRAVNVITEIADVIIMAGQMRLLFGADAVDAEIEEKLERLEYRLDGVKA